VKAEPLSETGVVRDLANASIRRVVRSVVRYLQSLPGLTSEGDSELATVWDEVCAQVQGDQWTAWDSFDEVVR
jgi:hypothetical protein